MKKIGDSHLGVSPVIAIILMVAITIIIASVTAVWVFSFLGDGNTDKVDQYLFDVSLSGSDDTITISPMKGDPLPTAIMTVYINEQQVILPPMNVTVGTNMVASSPLDLSPGITYEVKIIIHDELQYDHDRIAAP
jgi:FlaG/FlaF family flagellin (archaellin)